MGSARDHLGGEGYVGGDHEVAGLTCSVDLMVSDAEAAGHAHAPMKGDEGTRSSVLATSVVKICARALGGSGTGSRALMTPRHASASTQICTRRNQNPATYGSFLAVASIAAPASSSTAVESHVPATS